MGVWATEGDLKMNLRGKITSLKFEKLRDKITPWNFRNWGTKLPHEILEIEGQNYPMKFFKLRIKLPHEIWEIEEWNYILEIWDIEG